ncbi:MAG: hypothetical protein MZU97_24840 [Bacillus subtilis]|nr:hypothetical protein [Bacillus subtilis]
MDETNDNELDNVVFLVTGERHEPFFMLQRMAKGFDRLLETNGKGYGVDAVPADHRNRKNRRQNL